MVALMMRGAPGNESKPSESALCWVTSPESIEVPSPHDGPPIGEGWADSVFQACTTASAMTIFTSLSSGVSTLPSREPTTGPVVLLDKGGVAPLV